MKKIGNDWDDFLQQETEKEYYLHLRDFLKKEYATKVIYPPMHDIFNAFRYTPYSEVKVVILGQDPYINDGEAHGLAFSVKETASTPPSLRNVFQELSTDLGCYIPNNGHLVKWTQQGVMLLNTVLTVERKNSKSHAKKGWEQLTSAAVSKLNEREKPVVFLLWGNDAKEKTALITNPKHKILTAAHPSPLAGGRFFGSKHFSQTNQFLKSIGEKEIDWQIENVKK